MLRSALLIVTLASMHAIAAAQTQTWEPTRLVSYGVNVEAELYVEPEMLYWDWSEAMGGDPDRPLVVGRVYHAERATAEVIALEYLILAHLSDANGILPTSLKIFVCPADLTSRSGSWTLYFLPYIEQENLYEN